jgi:hypothetical protein
VEEEVKKELENVTSSDNLANKRVKFNAIVEQAEFEKLSSEEEDNDMLNLEDEEED